MEHQFSEEEAEASRSRILSRATLPVSNTLTGDELKWVSIMTRLPFLIAL